MGRNLGEDTRDDVSPDGQRFVAIKPSETAPERPRAHVVLNWTEELTRASP